MSSRKPIYLDYNATTPCAPEVVQAMLPFFSEDCANPASPHIMGREAASAVEIARGRIAHLIDCDPDEVVFSSGATESNNIVLLGVAYRHPARMKIVISAIEHKSVLEPGSWLAERGFTVVTLPVNGRGIVDLDAALSVIDDGTLLVSVQGANNETGSIQPLAEIAQIAHSHGVLMHSDLAQMLGKVPVSVRSLGVDCASFSGHKAYGPKGSGFLFAEKCWCLPKLGPICLGGGQENNLRPGTLNVPAIVGLGEACRLAARDLATEMVRISGLRNLLESRILGKVPGARVNGSIQSRLPGTTSLTFKGIAADLLIARLPRICVSNGAACSSGALAPSHVLLAMGLSRDDAESTVRISLGRFTTLEHVQEAAYAITEEALKLLSE